MGGIALFASDWPSHDFPGPRVTLAAFDRLSYRTGALAGYLSMTDWEAVVSQHVAAVQRTVCRLVDDCEDQWDCIQETFLEAVRIDRREPVRNWPALLRHLATVRALDLLRAR